MEWKKVKTMMIFVLLATNIILGANVYSILSERYNSEKVAFSDAISLAEQSGLYIDSTMAHKLPISMNYYSIIRDAQQELDFAALFLSGEITSQSPGSGINIYTTDVGKLSIRRGGAIEGDIPRNDLTPEDFLLTLGQLNGSMDFEHSIDGDVLTIIQSSGYNTPLLNSRLLCTFSDERISIVGNWVIAQSWEKGSFGKSRAELMISLMNTAALQGATRVLDLFPAYYIIGFAADAYYITPVWQAETDIGTFVLNVYNGELLE